MTEKETHTIDAAGKSLGRVASEAATLLLGKNRTSYSPNTAARVSVTITNAAQTVIGEQKKSGTSYLRYSGYPGGQREETLEDVLKHKGIVEVYRRAVYGMLPGNKLRNERLKNLTVTE